MATSLSVSDIDRQIEQLRRCEVISGTLVVQDMPSLVDTTVISCIWLPQGSMSPPYLLLRILFTEAEVRALCQKAMEILIEESNVQRVDAPVTVSSLHFSCNTNASFVEGFQSHMQSPFHEC